MGGAGPPAGPFSRKVPYMRSHRLKALLLACSCLSALACSGVANAQEAKATEAAPAGDTANQNQVIRYEPDFFKQFQVTSALDMVFSVPGFTFSGGQQVRGFAGAAGNVLIDGQRPVSKNGLEGTLNNISAAQVDHVELIVGGAPGIDMQGYGKVVNVVRKTGGKATISFGGNVKFFPGDPKPAGFFSYSKNAGGISTDFYTEAFGFNDNGVQNTKRFTYTPSFSDPTPEYMYIAQKGGGVGNQVKLDHSRPFLGGKLSFNGNYNPVYYDFDAHYDDAATDGIEHLDYKEVNSEMGLQFERKLNKSWTLDLNALRRHNRESQADVYSDPSDTYHYTSLALTDEHILSAKLSWQLNKTLSFKFGAENAYNSLTNTSLFATTTSVPAAPEVVTVEEDRNEYFVVSNWQATPKINVEAAMRVETSTISVKQDNRSQSFVYPKPKLQVVWSPTDKFKVTGRVERVVGQLRFGDFARSVNLQTTVVTAGNTTIVPQKQWQNALTLDYSFWEKGSLSVTVEHDDLEDVLDHMAIVTTSGTFDARGNIGDGKIDSINVALNLPLDKLYVKGGTLKFDYTRRSTHVIDPVTLQDRAISGMNPDDYTIGFYQSLPKHNTSWGVDLQSLNNAFQYNAKELYRYKSAPWITMYAEYKTKSGLTYAVILQNPLRRRDQYWRSTWSGLRDQSPMAQQEYNVSFMKPWVILRVRKELH